MAIYCSKDNGMCEEISICNHCVSFKLNRDNAEQSTCSDENSPFETCHPLDGCDEFVCVMTGADEVSVAVDILSDRGGQQEEMWAVVLLECARVLGTHKGQMGYHTLFGRSSTDMHDASFSNASVAKKNSRSRSSHGPLRISSSGYSSSLVHYFDVRTSVFG